MKLVFALMLAACCSAASGTQRAGNFIRGGSVPHKLLRHHVAGPVRVEAGDRFTVGVGKADITGPAADVNMMGYAMLGQVTGGISIRQYARAFIFDDGAKRVLFVNLDACMASQALSFEVLKRLKASYGDLYTTENVAITGVHTHAGPAGYLEYLLYSITSLGFVKETFEAHVTGIMRAIDRAHSDLQPATMSLIQQQLLNASVNRSPAAYLRNPADERALYQHDTDKDATALIVRTPSGGLRGAVQWFAVHCTSLNNTNQLISGDNKGLASQLLERELAPNNPGFVSAFTQANVGDTSPNLQGAFCGATDTPCAEDSTCGGRSQACNGRGPAWPDDAASNHIIADRQAQHLHGAISNTKEQSAVRGGVDFRHAYVDMSNVEVQASNYTRAGKTCLPAMGFSFAAGTTDGPGAFDFRQNDTSGSPFWRMVAGFIKKPSAEQVACHAPKPVLLSTGELNEPYPWQPSIVPISLLRVGQLFIACVPAEFTTMSGRRLKRMLLDKLRPTFGEDSKVVIAGLCNGYSSYVTTFEEYQIQRYEGASTIYGPHTLDAYLQEFAKLAEGMVEGKLVPPGPTPPDLMSKQISLLPPVVIDAAPFGKSFGGVVDGCDAKPEYTIGEKVKVTFHAACPRNDVRLEGTFMTVQKRGDGGDWATVLTDDAWETAFRWSRPFSLSPFSLATMEWTITPNIEPGEYRIQYFGDAKEFFGARPKAFQGASQPFLVKRPGFVGRSGFGSFMPWLAKQWSPPREDRHDAALRRMVLMLREAYAADYASA